MEPASASVSLIRKLGADSRSIFTKFGKSDMDNTEKYRANAEHFQRMASKQG